MENPVIQGRIQMERFIPVECFREKGNNFRGIPFSRFYRNSRIQADESLLFHTVRDVTAVLFSRLLLTDFLQHHCSTQGEKDLSFGRRRYLCFTFAFMIRASDLNGAGKHLHPKLRV